MVSQITFHDAPLRKHIFTTASSEEKLQVLHKLIGDQEIFHTINYKKENFEEKIKDVTGNKGVDVLIDFVGQAHWNKNLGSLALDGRMVLLGLLSGWSLMASIRLSQQCFTGLEVEKTSLGPILFKRLQITGTTLRSRSKEYQTEHIQRFGKEVLPKISCHTFDDKGNGGKDDKTIRVVLHRTYPLADIVKAHQDMETDAYVGKIVIEV
jgi:NADPH:quinone reductase-like Zn-dependent oxidoreductase